MTESILKTEVERKLLELCEATLKDLSFRVVDVECKVGPKSLCRLFIERTTEDKGPTLDDCATVSRLLDPVLESSTLLPGSFDFEVSSPGLDRRLRLREDFGQVIGKEVRLSLHEKLEGLGANMRAKLLRVEPNDLVLHYQGKEVPVPLNKIRKAHLVWEFNNERG